VNCLARGARAAVEHTKDAGDWASFDQQRSITRR